jgi:hypothetical protein
VHHHAKLGWLHTVNIAKLELHLPELTFFYGSGFSYPQSKFARIEKWM